MSLKELERRIHLAQRSKSQNDQFIREIGDGDD